MAVSDGDNVDLPEPDGRPVAVVGAGTLGRRVAPMFATRGADACISDPDAEQRAAAVRYVDGALPEVVTQVESGRAGRVTATDDLAAAVAGDLGAPRGPFRRMDAVGLDVVLDIEERYAAERPGLPEGPRRLLREMLAANRLGDKSGGGSTTRPARWSLGRADGLRRRRPAPPDTRSRRRVRDRTG